jgi:aspartyl-tRNA(Asn)/glutamyl-tRNA(Gln) amidotransferase subunit A
VSDLREGELETAVEIRAALDAREVTAVEVAERTVERANAWQPYLNAFSQLWADEALEAARRFDARPPERERPTGGQALGGVPLAVKDLFDVAGKPSTGCCAAYRDNVATADAVTIDRIRAAEMIMIGKTNQHELAAGGTNTVSACGRTGNPWDAERMTGGSSGGSAAAVAAGVVPLALGSDTGGSIRIPSSMCGAFGLKPTTGRIPTAGLMPLAPSMDCPGPLAATVKDLESLYEAMAGRSRGSSEPGAPPFRVAVPNGFFADGVHREVLRALAEAAAALEATGVTIEPIDGHGIEDARVTWMQVCTPEFAAAHPVLRDRLELVHPQVREWLELGMTLTEDVRSRAAGRRREITQWFRKRLEGFHALLVPTTPYPAPLADQDVVDLGSAGTIPVDVVGPGWMTCSVNLSGLPAINLPAGRSSDGLPIGVTLVGKEDDEGMLFRLAGLWEGSSGYRPVRPALPV